MMSKLDWSMCTQRCGGDTVNIYDASFDVCASINSTTGARLLCFSFKITEYISGLNPVAREIKATFSSCADIVNRSIELIPVEPFTDVSDAKVFCEQHLHYLLDTIAESL